MRECRFLFSVVDSINLVRLKISCRGCQVGTHPDETSKGTFAVFRQWFSGHYEQEENRLTVLRDSLENLEGISKIRGGGDFCTTKIREFTLGPNSSVEEMEYGYADLQERIERQSEFPYGLAFTKNLSPRLYPKYHETYQVTYGIVLPNPSSMHIPAITNSETMTPTA